jgi:hypothetical protein
MQAIEGGGEEFAVIHHKTWQKTGTEPAGAASALFRAFPGLVSM